MLGSVSGGAPAAAAVVRPQQEEVLGAGSSCTHRKGRILHRGATRHYIAGSYVCFQRRGGVAMAFADRTLSKNAPEQRWQYHNSDRNLSSYASSKKTGSTHLITSCTNLCQAAGKIYRSTPLYSTPNNLQRGGWIARSAEFTVSEHNEIRCCQSPCRADSSGGRRCAQSAPG